MASSEDFKRILELYNQEAKTSDVSIVAFCQKNGIVYSQFERWYKNRHKVKVHAVDIVDRDGTIQCRKQNCKALVAMLLKFPSRKMSDFPSRHCLQYS